MSTTTLDRPVAVVTTPRPRLWRRVADVLGTIIAIVVVTIGVLAVVVAIATRLSPKGEYEVFGHPVLTVLSGSMTPTIRTGDLIVDNGVSAVQAEHLQVGQIISVRDSPGSATIITHRIVRVERRGGAVFYITKGDANNAPDAAPRPASDIVGVFHNAIPGGGYVLAALHRPIVLALLLASPMLWLLSGWLFKLAREMDEPGEGNPSPAPAGDSEAGGP